MSKAIYPSQIDLCSIGCIYGRLKKSVLKALVSLVPWMFGIYDGMTLVAFEVGDLLWDPW